MTTIQSPRRFSFGIRCIQCGTEQIAPQRAEYWTDRHAFHIWHCPNCTVSLAIKDTKTGNDIFPSRLVA